MQQGGTSHSRAPQKKPRRVRMSTSFPPIIHMFSTGRFRRALFVALTLASPAASGASGVTHAARQTSAPATADATLFRVFLRDGSTLVSYGEYARVADRVIVTLPLGPLGSTPP